MKSNNAHWTGITKEIIASYMAKAGSNENAKRTLSVEGIALQNLLH